MLSRRPRPSAAAQDRHRRPQRQPKAATGPIYRIERGPSRPTALTPCSNPKAAPHRWIRAKERALVERLMAFFLMHEADPPEYFWPSDIATYIGANPGHTGTLVQFYTGVKLIRNYRCQGRSNLRTRGVDGQRKCPAKWPAKMSLVLLAMITDVSYPTRSRLMGGLTASMYFFAVARWMPSSRATSRIDNPLRLAF